VYHDRQGKQPFFAILAAFILSIHSLLAGAALGISGSFSIGIMILLAILAHKWAASFALAVHLNQAKLSGAARATSFLIFAICAPVGVILGDLVTTQAAIHPLLEPVIISLSAGTFLYLGTLHGLARSVMVSKCCNLKDFSYVIIGFLLMALVAIWT
jgi:zinc transporter ZupT